MINTTKFSGPVRPGILSSDPVDPKNGDIYYNSSLEVFRIYQAGTFKTVADTSAIISEFIDSGFRIQNSSDSTKKIAFDAAAIATSTTRTLTLPNANVNLGEVNSSIQTDGSRPFAADQSVGGFKLTNLASGTASGDAITKAQLDAISSIIQNFEWQESAISVELDSTTIVAPSLGDRYLVAGTGTNAFATHDNTIAEWDGAAWVFTVPTTGTFISVDDESDGLYQFGGVSWTKKYFEATTASTGLVKVGFDVRLDTSSAGDGLGFAGGTLSVNVDSSTIEINADILRVKDAGITSAKLAPSLDLGTPSVLVGTYITGTASGLTAGNVTTNANLTGPITSVGNATSVASQTGTGSTFVMNTSPTLVTPNIGAATLGGDMTLGTNVLIHGSGGLKRGTSTSNFVQEEYFHSIALSASQTNITITELTFAHATYAALKMTYYIKEATSNDVRIGDLLVVSNGTAIDFVDTGAQTDPTGITFSAVISGSDVIIRYSSGSNGATLRADVKRFLA